MTSKREEIQSASKNVLRIISQIKKRLWGKVEVKIVNEISLSTNPGKSILTEIWETKPRLCIYTKNVSNLP